MCLQADCCWAFSKLEDKVSDSQGLRVGHLYDKAKEMVEAHRIYPHARASSLDENGCYAAKVSFRGTVRLQLNDPFFGGRYSERRNSEDIVTKLLNDANGVNGPKASPRMQAYTIAKRCSKCKVCHLATKNHSEANDHSCRNGFANPNVGRI